MTETPRHIYLTGMPGAGKSSVAPMLAQILGMPWVDTDDRFATVEGIPPADFIRLHGEKTFRRREAEVLRSVTLGESSVVACGGGTLLATPSFRLADRTGIIICLLARVETLARRLGSAHKHPLLRGDDLETVLRRLESARSGSYSRARHQIITDGLSPLAIAGRISQLSGVRCLDTRTTAQLSMVSHNVAGLYLRIPPEPVRVELIAGDPSSALERATDHAAQGARKLLIVDSGIPQNMQIALERAVNPHLGVIVWPAGEQAKSMETARDGLLRLMSSGCSRNSLTVIAGGGSVLDGAAFCTSVFMRGIRHVLIPTTLLAAADAAIGGKTALDLGPVKNLAGTFRNPASVLVPLEWVAMEAEQTGGTDGCAELLKMALLSGDRQQAELVVSTSQKRRTWLETVQELVTSGIRTKVSVVEKDPWDEHGTRSMLNLGHTFAHGLEQATGFVLSHGRAVGAGLVGAARASVMTGAADQSLADEVTDLCRACGLWPLEMKVKAHAVLEGILNDKKRCAAGVNLVLLEGWGRPLVRTVLPEELEKLLVECLDPIVM